MKAAVIQIARRALPLMNPTHRAEAARIIAHFERGGDGGDDVMANYLHRAGRAFEKDLQPVCGAIVAALHAGHDGALRGLRHLLPGLLREVNRVPSMAAVLAGAMVAAIGSDAPLHSANSADGDPEEIETDSMRHHRAKRVFETDMSSGELRGMAREVKERAIFSARTTSVEYLDEVAAVVDDMLSGKINLAAGRLCLLRKLAELGYDPEIGFPDDMAAIPPAERGSLQDLSSQQRIDLMLRTLVAQARNYARVQAGNSAEARFAFPAWELVRVGVREVPRGFRKVQDHLVADPPGAWPRRWEGAGDSIGWEGAVREPMIARKDSPIWQALGDGAGTERRDTLGNPYPPFAFNSGMDWRAVPRAEAAALDLGMDGMESPAPMEASLAPGDAEITRAADHIDREDLRAELLRELAAWRAAA